jgi:hypothetical protein
VTRKEASGGSSSEMEEAIGVQIHFHTAGRRRKVITASLLECYGHSVGSYEHTA